MRFIENYKTILEKMFIRNKILDNQNESDFSKLIQDCSIPELRKNLLEKLSERSGKLADNTEPTNESPVYMMTAHFYGHLGRLYSRDSTGLINYGKAVEYSRRSLYYLEKCNGQDSLMHQTGREIDLNVLLEEREIRSNFAHKGSLELCMSLIRFYNVLRRMLIFMNEDYKVRLVEFQYPEEICCDIQKLAGHFGFDHFENKTTVLIIGSMHDIPQHQLSLIANMPWNIVIDFDGGTTGGGLADAAESSGIHNQFLNQTVANGITISSGITEWLTCGQFLKPSPPTEVKNLFDAKLPFYSGRFHQYYRYVHDTLKPVFEKLENEQNKVSILFMYYDEGILKKVIDLCEEYLDSVSYSLSAVYYWDQEKCENIEKDMYSTYIRKGESYSDRFQIFPCDFPSFFEGLESYEILPSLTKQGADERKLPTGTGLKEVPVNLVTRLEKYFDVLYANCGEEDPADAGL